MSKETETVDFTHGEPLENVSITTRIEDYPPKPQDIELSDCRPPNAPPVCLECE
jgi:hypothetical protein